MKLKKWFLAIAAFAVMAVVCAVAAGAENYSYGDFSYTVLDYGTVKITDYNGSAEKIDIPAEIDGKSVTNIGIYAFRECTSLKSVTIPNSVTIIDMWAFFCCTNLTSVSIPESVTSIGWSAFGGCRSLIAIDVAVDNKNYASMNGVLFNKDKTELLYYPCNKNDNIYTIPDSVTNIAEQAFNGCTSLKSVTIPNGVTSIDNYAFVYCRNITNITIPDSVASIGDGAFSGCTSLKSITIPDSVTQIGSRAFEETALLDSQTTPVKYADLWVVDCESDVENVIIKNGTKGISDYSFYGCSSLIGITIPDGVTSIGEYAFSGCSSLTSIAIPNGVTEIGYRTFEGCRSLTSIMIPNGVTSIEWYAFSGCTSLKSITIPNSVTSIGDSAFEDCSSLTSITIPNSVTSIGSNAFGYNYDNGYKKIDNFKIYCYSGTASEKYAKDNDFDYVLLDKLPTLAKITGAKLTGRAADALRINWTKNASADGYIVEMYQGNKWVRVAKITSNNMTTFRKAGLKAGTVYKFRVKAYKMSGKTAVYGAYSASVAARTNPSVIKGAKLGGRATDALRINWTKNTSADGYIVEMYQGNKWVRAGKITNNSTTTFRKAGLKASSVYKFRVKAYKMSGSTALYGNYSATVTARTNPSVVKGAKLGGRAADALRINWSKNASADGYIVEMYKSGKWVRAAKIAKNSTTTYRKAGLKASTVYKFRVKAYKMSGSTALYGNYSATVTARTNPSAMTGVKLGGSAADALRINWSKNTSADGYIVEMYQGGKWVRAVKIAKNSTTTYRKAGLKACTAYKFRVKAYKMSGKTALYGAYSATLSANTIPSNVSRFRLNSKTGKMLNLGWDMSDDAAGYIVQQYKGGKWVQVAKLSKSKDRVRINSLSPSTTYKFRIRKYAKIGKTTVYGNWNYKSFKTEGKDCVDEVKFTPNGEKISKEQAMYIDEIWGEKYYEKPVKKWVVTGIGYAFQYAVPVYTPIAYTLYFGFSVEIIGETNNDFYITDDGYYFETYSLVNHEPSESEKIF